MRVLLDTNIIIHRENTKVTSYSIGELFYWLDKLHYEKMIHPYTINELRKYKDSQMQDLYDAKLSAYSEMKCVAQQSIEFINLLNDDPKTENDKIDNQLLYEVFCGRADLLITEDHRLYEKANRVGIKDKVFTINSFIDKANRENPDLIDYKALSVKQEYIGNIDINDPFFDSLKTSYPKFIGWFATKCNEIAYVCRSDKNKILISYHRFLPQQVPPQVVDC